MNPLQYLLEHTWVIAGAPILVREVVGNGFGLASAVFGMRRVTWAWPVGMIGNALLFTVFVHGIFDK
ncbi:MAG: nicotinamide mononucleotide transporter, partial [Nocardioidaceae bacterium]